MEIVFAQTTAQVAGPAGTPVLVVHGTHWPAADPVVRAYPSLFSQDPRHGLQASVPIDQLTPPAAAAGGGRGRR